MKITVKYFASLREQLGKAEELLTLNAPVSISEIWKRVCGDPLSDNILMAINMEYVKPDTLVKEGDEIAFFPPVTGG